MLDYFLLSAVEGAVVFSLELADRALEMVGD